MRILPAWCDEDGRIRFDLVPDDAPVFDVELPEPQPSAFHWNGVLVEDEEVEA